METDQMPLTLDKPLALPEVFSEEPEMIAVPEPEEETAPEPYLSRRQFLLRSAALVGTVALGEGVSELSNVEVTRHQVAMRGLSEPVRLVQLTDLHRSWSVSESYIARIIDMTNALHPDVVALTGDY